MFQLKLRQAETAFQAGRLEEACQLALTPEVYEHRSGKQLVTKLVDALLVRAQRHLENSRFSEARSDCQLAKRMGGNQELLVELSTSIENASHRNESDKRRVNQLVNAADKELQKGQFGWGEKILNQLPIEDSNAVRLAGRIVVQKEQIDGALTRAEKAVESGVLSEAIAAVAKFKKSSPEHSELPSLIQRIIAPACEDVANDIQSARLDRAERTLESCSGDA